LGSFSVVAPALNRGNAAGQQKHYWALAIYYPNDWQEIPAARHTVYKKGLREPELRIRL